MKRIFYIILIIVSFWILWEGTSIYMALDKYESTFGHFILKDRHGNYLSILPQKGGYSIPYTAPLDNALVKDIVLIEDRRFFSHFGIDIVSKMNVLRESILAKRFTRGGSTITEQLVKNTYFPDAPRTIQQKVREAFWAGIMELRYSKLEILKKYLETVYMGNGLYGVAAAQETYFYTETISTLSDTSIQEIIVRLRYPNLGGSSTEYQKQIAEKLGMNNPLKVLEKRENKDYTNLFPFLTERIKKEKERYCAGGVSSLHSFVFDIPTNLCSTPFITLTTSIDMEATLKGSEALESIIYTLEEKNVHNGAIYVWSVKEQKVMLYIGNRNDSTGNAYDMIQKRRSVGSILKPFIYLITLHRYDPNSLILDEKKVYETEQEGISYMPENYIPKAYGPVTLKNALGNSLNTAAVRLAEDIGISRIYASFTSLGLDLNHDAGYYGYGIALGAVELALENIVHGYTNLTNLNDPENYLLFDMLSEGMNRSMTFGASSILNTSIPLAVKTGTSTDFRDNWTIGYNSDVIIGVWVGNTDNSSMDDVSGVTGAGPIFHRVAEDLIARGYIQQNNSPLPPGVVSMSLCLDEKCFQKEMTLTRHEYTRKSRPKSNIYYKEDFVTPLTEEEKTKWKIR